MRSAAGKFPGVLINRGCDWHQRSWHDILDRAGEREVGQARVAMLTNVISTQVLDERVIAGVL